MVKTRWRNASKKGFTSECNFSVHIPLKPNGSLLVSTLHLLILNQVCLLQSIRPITILPSSLRHQSNSFLWVNGYSTERGQKGGHPSIQCMTSTENPKKNTETDSHPWNEPNQSIKSLMGIEFSPINNVVKPPRGLAQMIKGWGMGGFSFKS